ncbi:MULTISPECIES: nitroreductase [Hyphobacterium]|uniref:Nitroreductase n=1 Tax=Hyphobacterium vulgare TaxID=1736751 RepID=A0ABV6ZUH8_9PROT
MQVGEALRGRISTRAFLDRPVDEATLRGILDTARWAPSGGNLQPWKVHVVTGAARQRVIDAVKARLNTDPFADENDFPVYPEKLWEPYRSRRYDLGEAMYELLAIPREDKMGRLNHLLKNLDFFDAPVGLFFVIERAMNPNQWAHLGMFMLAVALAAGEAGLATCMQEAWTRYSKTVGAALGVAEGEQVYCGMALGHADPNAPVNRLRSPRAPVDDFAVFHAD